MKIVQIGVGPKQVPLTGYLQDYVDDGGIKNIRPSIVVCAGGAYRFLSWREKDPVALHFLSLGYNVFLLDYSVKEDAKDLEPLKEASDALVKIRLHGVFGEPQRIAMRGAFGKPQQNRHGRRIENDDRPFGGSLSPRLHWLLHRFVLRPLHVAAILKQTQQQEKHKQLGYEREHGTHSRNDAVDQDARKDGQYAKRGKPCPRCFRRWWRRRSG